MSAYLFLLFEHDDSYNYLTKLGGMIMSSMKEDNFAPTVCMLAKGSVMMGTKRFSNEGAKTFLFLSLMLMVEDWSCKYLISSEISPRSAFE